MGFNPPREIESERSGYEAKNIREEEDLTREKYGNAAKILLCKLYDDWTIHDYEKFLARQADDKVIFDPLAPNYTKYELDDLLALKSKNITDFDKQIKILSKRTKYTEIIDWSETPPNMTIRKGTTMDFEYMDETYKFLMTERKVGFKKIYGLAYDKVIVDVYKSANSPIKYKRVATASFYYYSGSRFLLRYVTLYNDEGGEILDWSHITEYNIDNNTDYVRT